MNVGFDVVVLELIYHAGGALLEALEVIRRPPVVEPALCVELCSLIVKTMANLMANHNADRAVVDGVNCVHVESGGLKDAGGKYDFIEQRIVVRIGGGWSHAPTTTISWFADGETVVINIEFPPSYYIRPE